MLWAMAYNMTELRDLLAIPRNRFAGLFGVHERTVAHWDNGKSPHGAPLLLLNAINEVVLTGPATHERVMTLLATSAMRGGLPVLMERLLLRAAGPA